MRRAAAGWRWILFGGLAAIACGGPIDAGGGSGGTTPAAVTVAIAPQSSNLPPGGTQRFTATVSGTQDTAVRWSADAGSIGADGVYTAPATAGTFHVTATSHADPAATASATVTVAAAPQISITIDPPVANLKPGAQQQFRAVVTGSSDRDVLWSVTETPGGSIDAQGLYTAPAGGGTFHVVARSHADPTQAAQATVSVSQAPQITISISPASAAVEVNGTVQFHGSVTGTDDAALIWSADSGSVDPNGVFTAPAQPGTTHVTVKSHADPSKSQTATVNVVPAAKVSVTVDPAAVTIPLGRTQQLDAHVTGASDTRVTWTADSGTVTPAGLYTPTAAGTWHVTATSVAFPSASAAATITVTSEGVRVAIDPPQASAGPGATVKFTATVTGTTDTRVHFTLCCATSGSAADDGTVVAPQTAGTYDVDAQSLADPAQHAKASLVVAVQGTPVRVRVDPGNATVLPGGTLEFKATVTGTTNTGVKWSVDGTDANGSIDPQGRYSAPLSEGIRYVRATSAADPQQSAAATVSVSWNGMVDHGGDVRATVRAWALWWGDATAFVSDNRKLVEGLLGNLSGTPYAAVLDQYMHGAKPAISFGGSLFDASAPPASEPTATALATEACAAFDKAGITPGANEMVFVYTANFPSTFAYCGWHSYESCHGVPILVAYMPNAALSTNAGFQCFQASNGCNTASLPANGSANITAHELFEAMTDPFLNAWFDVNGRELADRCSWDATCAVLGGSGYQIQRMYSNTTHGCVP